MSVQTELSSNENDRREAMIERVFTDAVGTFDLVHVYLGERLGLLRALVDGGQATSAELAERTGLHERYVREWLEQGAVGGVLEVEHASVAPNQRRYVLPAGHASALLDADRVGFATPTAVAVVGALSALPLVLDVFRSGAGFAFEAAGDDMRTGEASANRPMYLSQLGSEWIPAMPDLHARLLADPPARVADIGLGFGWSAIGLARSYPKVTIDGLDLDGPSVEAANRNAAQAGLADRIRVVVRDAADPALSGRYDLVTAFECLHDMAQPVATLRAMRDLLAPGGSVFIADEKADETFVAPGDDLQRYLYGWSVIDCLPSSMNGPNSAGTGTVMRPATLEAYAREAGLGSFEIVPIEHDSWRFYRLRA